MNERHHWNILFLCSGNSARSILAESLLRRYGGDALRAFSAGSEPAGEVQPLAMDLIRQSGLPDEGLRGKSLDEFLGPDAPQIDIVITVCDRAAVNCPAFPGRPNTVHWSTPDPAGVTGSEEQRRQAYRNARAELEGRIRLLVNLPLDSLDRLARQQRLEDLGKPAATA